jgi:hypothetical protein
VPALYTAGNAEELKRPLLEKSRVFIEEFSFRPAGRIRISTLHSSKGLDFPVVLLYLPCLHRRKAYDEQQTERLLRNLVCVGITRVSRSAASPCARVESAENWNPPCRKPILEGSALGGGAPMSPRQARLQSPSPPRLTEEAQEFRAERSRWFSWSPGIDTLVALLTEVAMARVYWSKTHVLTAGWDGILVFGVPTNLGLNVLLPIWWLVYCRGQLLSELGATSRSPLISRTWQTLQRPEAIGDTGVMGAAPRARRCSTSCHLAEKELPTAY